MTKINLEDVHADIDKATERQEYSAGKESVCEILRSIAGEKCDYWHKAACELHSREKFYEALDCWQEAEKYIEQLNDEVAFLYEDMVRTLINAAEQSGDTYFYQQALKASIRACEINESEDIWSLRLQLTIQLRLDIEKFSTLECMLDKGFDVEGINGDLLGNGYVEQVNNYDELAQCYLERKDVGEALRIWAKAVKDDTSKDSQILCNAIYWLLKHADKNNLDINDYLPENFEKINE